MSALARLALGTLSERERELTSAEPCGENPELREQLLYEHLHVAQQARLRMDAARSWSHQYHEDFMKRGNAIARAREHYTRLRELGAVDAFLERMAMTEGLQQ